jgi:hypothetical protein
MKIVRKKRRPGRARKKRVAPRTAKQYSANPQRFQDLWNRVVAVISKLRSQRTSLQQTSREVGVSPRTVIRYGGSALRKGTSGRYQVKKRDRLLRMLMVPTHQGPHEIAVLDSRQASVLGEYWNAVHRYLATGDASGIKKFEGRHIIDADGKPITLLANLGELNRLGSAGVLSFESLYGRTA